MYDAVAHFSALYRAAPGEFAFRAETRAEWIAWHEAFRPRLRQALGLDAMAADLAGHVPRAQQVDSEDLSTHIREAWHLWVEPTVPLPYYLLRPKDVVGPLPLVLTPHGHNHPHIYAGIAHSEQERNSIEAGERDIAVQAVEEGYLVIAPTTRAFGETRTAPDKAADATHSCHTQLLHDLLVGRTPIGDRVWDISCLIDWALGTQDVDAQRIAITGNSGGGTISLFAAACDPRIAIAVPSSYFCTFAGSIGSIRHCECNYVPGILRLGEMADVAGLIAPRPFCAIAGKDDPIFPIEHVRSAFEQLQRIYAVAGAPDACELYVGHEGHRYYKAGAWPFIRKHFGISSEHQGVRVEIRPLTAHELADLERSLPEGPADKHAERLHRQERGEVVYLVAWHEGRPVGHGLLKWQGAGEEPIASAMHGTCPDIEDLLVHEAYRSRGIGTQILREAERLALARGFHRIGLSVDERNPKAQALYERLGYHDAGLGPHHERGEYVDQEGQMQAWEETCVYLVRSLDGPA
jgi:ribosomal protein S18 acetylase RimI-like enzyme/dienelactone hydrolase